MTTQPAETLEDLDARAWARLTAASADAASPFRNLVISSVDNAGHPQSRYVVLRAVETALRRLEFHTDIRSAKWAELGVNPALTVLGYDPEQRLQIRLTGTATIFGPEKPEQTAAWTALSLWTRTTYCGGPPGDPLDQPEPGPSDPPSEAETAIGKSRFGVIRFRATALDAYQHPRGNIRRALYRYSDTGAIQSRAWIAP